MRRSFVVVFIAPSVLTLISAAPRSLDAELAARLRHLGFSGNVESTLTRRLGRNVDQQLAGLGRLLWFDTIGGLNNDNTCGGCHSPTTGFGDTQSIAIGIDNNGIVGPDRTGPRNQRRTPMIINSALFPRLMWNSRLESLSGDPFNNDHGFHVPCARGIDAVSSRSSAAGAGVHSANGESGSRRFRVSRGQRGHPP